MAIQTRGITPQLYDNVDKDVFTLLFDASKELAPIWKDLIDVRKSDRKFERVMSMTGVDTIPQKGEGAPYTSKILREGWTKDFIHTEYGAQFEVTETALEDDQFDQLAQHARWFMFAARVVEEQNAHLLYNNGFSSEQSPDGVSIFNTAHVLKGGGTARNTLATQADLSATSLEQALIDMGTETKVEAGQVVRAPQSLVLVVAPGNEFNAERILKSTLRPGSADNDANALKRRRWEIVVSQYITDADAWYLQDATKKNHGLRSYTRVGLQMQTPMTDPRTRNRLYPIRWRRSFGAAFWQNVFGVQGI